MKNICKVCGYIYNNPVFYPWGKDGHTPTFDICPCCGVEFGYEDSTNKGILKYRENWIKSGVEWYDKNKIVNTLKNLENNLWINGNEFIKPENMWTLIELIELYQFVPNLLITPYLINEQKQQVYELLYYEFYIEIVSNKKEKMKFNKKNKLPQMITENIIPGIRVDKQEYIYANDILRKYLKTMHSMSFDDERQSDQEYLYYQIF